ncbi:MAG: hypothetical protein ACLPIX_15815 [Rhodomicrobium sp.]
MKLLYSFLITLAFIAVLLIVYLVHVWYLPVHVVLYSAIGDAMLAAVIVSGCCVLMLRSLPLSKFELLLLSVIWILGGYAFAISGPAVLDRSLSFYILEKLQQRGGGIREDAIPKVFVEEYMPEFRLADVRITEQLQSGTIEVVNGCVRLTGYGRRLAALSHFIRRHLLAKHRLLAGVYTDALVDPFATSKKGPIGYECH